MIKMDIENKILIPFMVLVAFSIAILSMVSYWNGYRLLIDNQRTNQFDLVSEVLYTLETLDTDRAMRRDQVIEYFEGFKRHGLVILNQDAILVNQVSNGTDGELALSDAIGYIDRSISRGIYEDSGIMITFANEPRTGWTIAAVGAKNILDSELIDAQKYSILVAIISLILSMQATILIAHHLSRPIRQLAEQCNQMSAGDLETQLEMERNDEIGVLAEAFNQMIRRIQDNTKKLIEAKQFNEDILRSLSTGVLVTDRNGVVQTQNQAAKRMLNPQLSEFGTQRSFVDLLKDQLNKVLEASETVDDLYVLQMGATEERRYFATSTAPLINPQGEMTGAIFSFNDISERKRLELKMERVNRMASVGQLASGLAHEIRNPLAGMKTSLQVLMRRLVDSEEDRNTILFNNVLYEIDRMNKLVTELLDFAKPRNPEPKRFAIQEILQRSAALIAQVASDKQVRIVCDLPDEPVMVYADENQTEQVILNILTNAINASPENGRVKVLMNHPDLQGISFEEVVIEDEGSGISKKDLEKVFDPFFTTHATGTGLGLSVVQKLMTDNGGEVLLTSSEGAGTTVVLKFPKGTFQGGL
jgi:nitrogen fixation/metabolism regulation signal transduction histidine kinase